LDGLTLPNESSVAAKTEPYSTIPEVQPSLMAQVERFGGPSIEPLPIPSRQLCTGSRTAAQGHLPAFVGVTGQPIMSRKRSSGPACPENRCNRLHDRKEEGQASCDCHTGEPDVVHAAMAGKALALPEKAHCVPLAVTGGSELKR
jgi:hypothetical protein